MMILLYNFGETKKSCSAKLHDCFFRGTFLQKKHLLFLEEDEGEVGLEENESDSFFVSRSCCCGVLLYVGILFLYDAPIKKSNDGKWDFPVWLLYCCWKISSLFFPQVGWFTWKSGFNLCEITCLFLILMENWRKYPWCFMDHLRHHFTTRSSGNTTTTFVYVTQK